MSTKVSIDGKDYNLDSLSDQVKAEITSLQFVETEIHRLQAQLAAMQTARIAYANSIKSGLPAMPDSDTIHFN